MMLETTARAIESFHRRPRVLRLECGVQHYDWGDPDAIPAILGRANRERRPFAELWAGAHPDLPSTAFVDDVRVPLDELIRAAPDEVLGAEVAARFDGELPFLLKILAAGKPLSIQAHPNSVQALQGFARENGEGLPLDAPTRSYHDPHHKPELLVALSDFYTLRGFRPLAEIARALGKTPELAPLAGHFRPDSDGLAALYGHLMRLEQASLNALLDPLIGRLVEEARDRRFTQEDPEYWILRADREFSAPGHRDHGLLSMFLLNLVHLRPGQAVYLPAGELHSYLDGMGMELMANSNNVLRGGLTHKHVDLEELLRVLSFHGAPADILTPESAPGLPGLVTYPTPAGEFALSRRALPSGGDCLLGGGDLVLALVTEGSVEFVEEGTPPKQVSGGEAILVPAGLSCRISSANGAVLGEARVPQG
ncbi:MAG: mannose-6-phosphate isomerase, class I [Pseudomonadota bacterium]|nr:mannose-6-phosphate isomerase, class I [Pseudomonadota bacterium]